MSFMRSNPRFLNTVLLGGTFTQKLNAIAKAGFDGVEVWQQDAEKAVAETQQQLDALSLTPTDYQVLIDFDGAVGNKRDEKRREALTMLATAHAIGSPMILVAANTAECDKQNIIKDIKWLCQQASERGLRVAYEAMSWSTEIDQCDKAWQIIQQVDEENLGLVIDAFHIFALRRTLQDLKDIPVKKIFLVQLSDIEMPQDTNKLKQIARHQRMLPGEGNFPLTELVVYLDELGYSGPIGLEVFNDHAAEQNCLDVAQRAKEALEKILLKGS
ncbi:sugar phosphate isomerase/epimerase family protein [Tatumella ptyseos]|uniref:sugar phosphate isomerase/epimerase family protein n=1 Tax=Tatumella ptyseos TaxID=82987 RepID=UPI0026EE6FF2|nr:sugar phosphate isomerase/epimerase family protein [Tatumella ptyseos]WKX27891.1 sugar phosphate isomerase/epimerase family protein [Tatumella ptyseos]